MDKFNTHVPELDDLPMRTYSCDFETTTDLEDCRVWAWACCEVGNVNNISYGNDLEGFIKHLERLATCKVYFHNLGFDGAFIMDWLERNGWLWIQDRSEAADRRYSTLISDDNQVYSITLYFTRMFKVTIYDSFKIMPLSVANLSKAYGIAESKGELDYTAYREPGHVLTEAEKDYISGDVRIVAQALEQYLSQNLTKMTAGSNALNAYKKSLGGNKKFRKVYPAITLEQDQFIRMAYRGGWTYCNPAIAGEVIGDGLVFDVNSLYPSVMYYEQLPMYEPLWFEGEPKEDTRFPLWVACASVRFQVKDGHWPCIQLKGNSRFVATEYITDSKGIQTMTFTNVDYELYREQYDFEVLEWHGGFRFYANDCQFRNYIDYWTEQKIEAGKEGNSGKRSIAKLMLNSLYGKFATRLECRSRRPELVDDVLRYTDLEPETREPVYLPVGVFVTSYARAKTVRAAQGVYDRFLYADTDSIHLSGTEQPEGLDVDPFALGKWAHESTFDQAKFLRAKCYIEHEVGADDLTVHVAGMPMRCHDQVTVENFGFGAIYQGKLYTHRVPGGIVLKEDVMEIRP